MKTESLNFTKGNSGGNPLWTHKASWELLDFAEKWLEKWTPALAADRKEHQSHYIGDTSNDARLAAALIHAVMEVIHGSPPDPGLERVGHVREFMGEPEVLWDALGLPPHVYPDDEKEEENE